MELNGQVALISGAGRGIGKAIARRFAQAGADVVLTDRNFANVSAAAAEIEATGRRALALEVDVTRQEQVQAALDETVRQFGKLDICVNNAGIAVGQHFLDITRENWDNHINIHLSGAFFCAQAAAREMARHGYGRIISIASIAGFMGPITLAPYGAAKSGIIGLTRAMALDLADFGITANAIAPGPIDTEMLREAWSPAAFEERANHIPVRRLGTVDEVARTALFLASPEASYISGSVITVDGGSVAAGAYMVEKYRQRKAGS